MDENERKRIKMAYRLAKQGEFEAALKVLDGLHSEKAEELRTKIVARVRQQIKQSVQVAQSIEDPFIAESKAASLSRQEPEPQPAPVVNPQPVPAGPQVHPLRRFEQWLKWRAVPAAILLVIAGTLVFYRPVRTNVTAFIGEQVFELRDSTSEPVELAMEETPEVEPNDLRGAGSDVDAETPEPEPNDIRESQPDDSAEDAPPVVEQNETVEPEAELTDVVVQEAEPTEFAPATAEPAVVAEENAPAGENVTLTGYRVQAADDLRLSDYPPLNDEQRRTSEDMGIALMQHLQTKDFDAALEMFHPTMREEATAFIVDHAIVDFDSFTLRRSYEGGGHYLNIVFDFEPKRVFDEDFVIYVNVAAEDAPVIVGIMIPNKREPGQWPYMLLPPEASRLNIPPQPGEPVPYSMRATEPDLNDLETIRYIEGLERMIAEETAKTQERRAAQDAGTEYTPPRSANEPWVIDEPLVFTSAQFGSGVYLNELPPGQYRASFEHTSGSTQFFNYSHLSECAHAHVTFWFNDSGAMFSDSTTFLILPGCDCEIVYRAGPRMDWTLTITPVDL